MKWSFGDETGWMIGAGLFLLLSVLLGWAVYGITHRLLSMGSLDQGRAVSRRPSLLLGTLVGLAVFASFYLTSLSGFLRLEHQHGQLTMTYILPARTVILPFIEVMNVQAEPAYKGHWRLVLTTDTSGSYESALSSQADVQQAAEWLRREMQQPVSQR